MLNCKNVIVTGGAGYIGSHACKALYKAGFNPIAYDNLVYGHEWAVKWGPLEKGDLLDEASLDRVFNNYKPVAVVHFAAFAYVGESVQHPGKYYRNNVVGSLNLLQAMERHNVSRIVFSSTCATYGCPVTLPIKEDAVQNPINPYGASKLMVERILNDYQVAYGIKSIALRYFNAAGADPDCEIGESHDPETHLIPLILDTVSGKRRIIQVFGNDYDTPDGTCIRDYIHVTDLADAHVLALQKLIESDCTRAYNLGNGIGFSVLEVIKSVELVTGKKVSYEIAPRRMGDPSRLIADTSLALLDLNWSPRFPQLEKIVADAWRWRNH